MVFAIKGVFVRKLDMLLMGMGGSKITILEEHNFVQPKRKSKSMSRRHVFTLLDRLAHGNRFLSP